ncbi:hypothetical protein EGH21_16070 [Halomicroarcula sp. F13]|uniref:Uncharacterized protein n=1 Tax=Haloarcula rubra TaxID=2487747 RepID=A0AAW4PTN3_9EURY|nr:hypothetical protein [Halomicroarcula rubra]MBX0324546.1 hypothetical protein [Halomicroarcula rubra]
MSQRLASRLESFFRAETDGSLRSIVNYEQGDFTVIYLRDDVGDQYATEEIDKAIDDSRLESLAAPIYSDIFSEDHGELTCLVKCFENVIEMNFVIEDGVGTTVALDSDAFGDTHGLVADAREIAIQERREAIGNNGN